MKKMISLMFLGGTLSLAGGFFGVVLWQNLTTGGSLAISSVSADGDVTATSDPLSGITGSSSVAPRAARVSLKNRLFSHLGIEDSVSQEDIDQLGDTPADVTIAHGRETDVAVGYDFDTYMDGIEKEQKEAEKARKKKEEKKEREEQEKNDAQENAVTESSDGAAETTEGGDNSTEEEDTQETAIAAINISEGLKKPYYPRDDEDDEGNRDAREALLTNASRDSSFGQIFDPVEEGIQEISIMADDAHQRRMLEEMKGMQVWAGNHSIIVSEVGITDDDDDEKYIALGHKFFEAANVMGFSTTGWAIGDWWGGYAGSLSQNSQISTTGVSAPFVENVSTNRYVRGLNLAGGEFGMDPDANGAVGAINDRYTYHAGSGLWQAMKNRGFTHARFPFRLERLFNADGSFNASDKADFMQAVAKARTVGMKILLDPHNYGAMRINDRKEVLGEGAFSVALYNTMMRNLAILSRDNADVIDMIGLMNEPKNLDPRIWEGYTQGAVDEIREAGFTGVIEVPTGNWQGIQDVARIHPDGPWITDPENNFMYGVHQYFDENHSGHYQRSYADDESILAQYYSPGAVFVWGVQ